MIPEQPRGVDDVPVTGTAREVDHDRTMIIPVTEVRESPGPKSDPAFGTDRARDADATTVIPTVDAEATTMIPAAGSDATTVIPAAWRPARILARLTVSGGQDAHHVDGARRRRRLYTLPVLGLAPELLAVSAVGVVLVAVAYLGGRDQASWAPYAYWVGQVVVFTPIVFRLLSRHLTGSTESFLLAIGLAINQYLLKWMYSPDEFRFPDELQHWLSTSIVIESGRLFQPNTALPVAAHFPGLEEVGAAVADLTGMSVTASGMLVAGILHLTFVGALFMMVRRAGGSPSMAGAACAIYATSLHYLFFDSMYIYQTAALPFLMVVVWATRAWRRDEPGYLPYALVGGVAVIVVAVSHHVTAVVMVGTLALLVACDRAAPRLFAGRGLAGRPSPRLSVPVLGGVALVVVTAWFTLVAHEIFDYLGAPLQSMTDSLTHLFAGQESQTSVAPGNPPWQLAIQAVSLLSLLIVLVRASWVAWHGRERDGWRLALLAGSYLFFATSALRVAGVQGPELAGRASTFTYVPMSLLAATTIVEWRRSLRPETWPGVVGRWLAGRWWVQPASLGAAMATLLLVGARLGGWPPTWGLLPGPYLVAGFERAVDAPGVSAAEWFRSSLGERNRVAADITGVTLTSTYGRQEPVREAADLYYDPVWGLRDQQILQSLQIGYVWVDMRMARQTPVSGAYFEGDPQADQHTSPIPLANLTKFDEIPGVNLVYDNGGIRIYDVRGA